MKIFKCRLENEGGAVHGIKEVDSMTDLCDINRVKIGFLFSNQTAAHYSEFVIQIGSEHLAKF